MLSESAANRRASRAQSSPEGVKRRRTELAVPGEDDAAARAAVTPPNDVDGTNDASPFRKTVGFSDRPTVRTFVVCNEEASSQRELSRAIKIAVKRARSWAKMCTMQPESGCECDCECECDCDCDSEALSSELAPFRSRIRELVTEADPSVYTLKTLREDLEAETGEDFSLPGLKRELKTEMQQVLVELSGGTLVAVD
jgi:hypothetical protein